MDFTSRDDWMTFALIGIVLLGMSMVSACCAWAGCKSHINTKLSECGYGLIESGNDTLFVKNTSTNAFEVIYKID